LFHHERAVKQIRTLFISDTPEALNPSSENSLYLDPST
jgi:hypothetical protein